MPAMDNLAQDRAAHVPAVDVPAVMREVRRRAWALRRERAELQQAAGQIVSPRLSLALAQLDLQIQTLRQTAASIGEMPPQAPTLRGRVGSILVRLIRRTLFWLLPGLKDSHAAALAALEAEQRALAEITLALRDLNTKLIALGRPATSPPPSSRDPK